MGTEDEAEGEDEEVDCGCACGVVAADEEEDDDEDARDDGAMECADDATVEGVGACVEVAAADCDRDCVDLVEAGAVLDGGGLDTEEEEAALTVTVSEAVVAEGCCDSSFEKAPMICAYRSCSSEISVNTPCSASKSADGVVLVAAVIVAPAWE